MNDQFKHAVTIAEMARMVGLSRSRFYQLIGKAFPLPCRDEAGKPFYAEEQQRVILAVRNRNCGVDGKPIMFYFPRHSALRRTLKRRPLCKEVHRQHPEIVDGVRGLGLTTATTIQVETAITELFPNGTAGFVAAEIIKQVFLYLKRQNSSDNVGR